jgi:glycosyltransferase involved in cell wall biosynthesis
MKICFLAHNIGSANGGGRLVLELVKHLKKNNFSEDIQVLTQMNTGQEFEKSILSDNFVEFVFSLPRLRAIFKKYDIIHAFDVFPYGLIAFAALLGLKKKLVITVVGTGSIQPLYNFWKLWLSKKVFKRADKIISISSNTVREIQKKIPGVNIEVIIPGVDYDYFSNLSKGVVSQEKNYILSVGAIKPRKGYEINLRVFAGVSAVMPQLKYIIVGSGRGEYFELLQNLVKQLHLEGRVIFKEYISDMELASLYKGAEMFLLLSQNDNFDVEGFGLVFLEAAAFGLPVVGSLNCGAEDAILNGENGFLIKPTDIEKAKEKVLMILNDQNLNLRFRKKSLQFAQETTYQKMTEKYLKIYEQA